ncbi:histamine H2 receptor-like [Oculina patagonica]
MEDGYSIAVFLSALNIFLSITAVLGNTLILFALHKVSSLHSSTKLLFRCLAVTDLCVGLISQPLFAIDFISEITNINPLYLYYANRVKSASSYILCLVSVLTSTAISVDRLLALLLGLRYRLVVKLRRVFAVVTCFWLIGVSCGVMYLGRNDIAWTVALVLTVLSLVTSAFSYIKIYLKLRHQQAQLHVQDHVHQGQPNGGRFTLNIARYKRTVSSIWWIQCALMICFVPFIIVATLRIHGGIGGKGLETARRIVVTLSYFNSSLNPILYCVKIREVRQAVKNAISQLNCCESNG